MTYLNSKPAHSDLLSALPEPTKKKSEMTLKEQMDLVRPFQEKLYSKAWLADPKVGSHAP